MPCIRERFARTVDQVARLFFGGRAVHPGDKTGALDLQLMGDKLGGGALIGSEHCSQTSTVGFCDYTAIRHLGTGGA